MAGSFESPHGRLEVHDDVIATLAGNALAGIDGVVGMSARSVKDGILEVLGRDNWSRGVEVLWDGDKMHLNLNVVVAYGVAIPEVAARVAQRVRTKVEEGSGIPVSHVEIRVNGVKVPDRP